MLPLALEEGELPSRVEDLTAERLSALSQDARRLCEALSVHTGRIPIDRCLALAEDMHEDRAYLALDELVHLVDAPGLRRKNPPSNPGCQQHRDLPPAS